MVASWERHISADVWVYCYDRVADGRVTRSATRIGHSDLPDVGLSGPRALALARALVAAAELATGIARTPDERPSAMMLGAVFAGRDGPKGSRFKSPL